MSRKRWIAVIAGAVVLLVGAGIVVRSLDLARPGAPRLGVAAAGFAAVERASLDACLCRRKGGSEAECDMIYTGARDAMLERVHGSAPPPPPIGDVSMCAPISTQVDCFDFADGTRCFTARYDVVAGSRDAALTEVCTAEEARAVEQTLELAWLGSDGRAPDNRDQAGYDAANRRANAAIDDVLRRIKAGERVSAPATSGGCAG